MLRPGHPRLPRSDGPPAGRLAPPPPRERLDFALSGVTALTPPTEFIEQAATLGLEFDPGDLDRLGRYLGMLLKANEMANLTAVTEPGPAWTRHLFDSLTLLPMLADLPEGARVIDVGSGGGLPGLPLAIAMPSLRFVLLEPTGKKAEFLRQAIAALGITNATVLAVRAEAAGQDRGVRTATGRSGGHRESYDAVVSRAVGALNVLAELTVPLVRTGGLVLLIKGQKADEELDQATRALRELRATHESTVSTPTGRVIVLSRVSATPRAYPRRDGEPKRVPL